MYIYITWLHSVVHTIENNSLNNRLCWIKCFFISCQITGGVSHTVKLNQIRPGRREVHTENRFKRMCNLSLNTFPALNIYLTSGLK